MSQAHHINADDLQLALVARRGVRSNSGAARFAAMADGRLGGPHLSPMWRGELLTVAERMQREQGREEVLRTFGCGIRALRYDVHAALRVCDATSAQGAAVPAEAEEAFA